MAATIQGVLKSTDGSLLQTQIEFESISAPTVGSGYVVSATKKLLSSDPVGAFSVQLEAGDYYVRWFNGTVRSQIIISVPDTSSTYQIEDLITSATVYTHTTSPIYAQQAPPNGSYRIKSGQHLQIYNSTTGLWHTLLCIGPAGALQVAFAAGEA